MVFVGLRRFIFFTHIMILSFPGLHVSCVHSAQTRHSSTRCSALPSSPGRAGPSEGQSRLLEGVGETTPPTRQLTLPKKPADTGFSRIGAFGGSLSAAATFDSLGEDGREAVRSDKEDDLQREFRGQGIRSRLEIVRLPVLLFPTLDGEVGGQGGQGVVLTVLPPSWPPWGP